MSKLTNLVCALLVAVITDATCLPAAAEKAEVTDVRGRTFPVELPAKRIVLGMYFEDFWAIGGGAAMDSVVGFSKAAWRDWRPDNWRAYLKVRPSLDKIADVGEVEVGTFSAEKVIGLRPDVAILAEWQAKAIGVDFQRILDAGIPIAVVDFHAQTTERHFASARVIGKLTGNAERAEAIIAEYRAAIENIQQRLANASEPRPSVYLELGIKGPGEQGPSYGEYMWGKMAAIAGGENISRDVVKTWGPVAREHVLASRPQVIVISGSEWRKHATGLLMGQEVSVDESQARLKGFTTRQGWQTLPAVRDGRVFGVYQGNSRTIMDFTSVQFLAKALHPALFADLDADANYRSFYRHYLPFVPEGTFMTQIRE
jgi:iron complex transport system substrate-binding protein